MVGPLSERLFAAVPIPPEVAAAVHAWQEAAAVPGRAVLPENLHITLRFVGDVDEVERDRWLAALDDADWPAPFRLRLGGLGGFPSLRKATVAWLAVEGDVGELAECARVADEAADEAGLGLEERPFRPHLTVSRIRPPRSLSTLDAPPLGVRVKVDHLVVFRSHLGRDGVRYEPIERFALPA